MNLLLGASVVGVAQVSQVTSTLDAGGGVSVRANLASEASVGGIVDVSSLPFNLRLANKAGFVGQLTEVVQIELTANPLVVAPGETTQFSGQGVLDDGSLISLAGAAVAWESQGFPITSIDANGRATTDPLVVKDALGMVLGRYQGFTNKAYVQVSPPLRIEPGDTEVIAGSTVVFKVQSQNYEDPKYQWTWNGVPIAGATNASISFVTVRVEDAGEVAVFITTPQVVATSAVQLKVRPARPAQLTGPPTLQLATNDQVVTAVFHVDVTGDEPLFFRWRLNGETLTNRIAPVNAGQLTERGRLEGATTATLRLIGARLADAGTYTVVIENGSGATNSPPIPLQFDLPELGADSSLPSPVTLNGSSGAGNSSNVITSPVVFSWKAPSQGFATFTTAGSGFDTKLSVYGENTELLAEDDESGGFHTSFLRFNTQPGRLYQVKVDGFAGSRGNILLQWTNEPTPVRLPTFLSQPQELVVELDENGAFKPNTTASFEAIVDADEDAIFSWSKNGIPLPNADQPSADGKTHRLVISPVGPANLGEYKLQITSPTGAWPVVYSRAVQLQAGTQTDVLARDRIEDLAVEGADQGAKGAIRIDVLGTQLKRLHRPNGRVARAGSGSLNAGVSGSAAASFVDATSSPGETVYKSKWFKMKVAQGPVQVLLDARALTLPANAVLSRIVVKAGDPDTPVGDAALVVADDSTGPYGLHPSVAFRAQADKLYYIQIATRTPLTDAIELRWEANIPDFEWVEPPFVVVGNTSLSPTIVMDLGLNHIKDVIAVYYAASRDGDDIHAQAFTLSEDRSRIEFGANAGYSYFLGVARANEYAGRKLIWSTQPTLTVSQPRGQLGVMNFKWEESEAGTFIPQTSNRLSGDEPWVDGTSRPFDPTQPSLREFQALMTEGQQYFRLRTK